MTLLYLDTSALFKRWVAEAGSEALLGGIEEDASAVGTALITRVQVTALAKAVRVAVCGSAQGREQFPQTTGPTSRQSD